MFKKNKEKINVEEKWKKPLEKYTWENSLVNKLRVDLSRWAPSVELFEFWFFCCLLFSPLFFSESCFSHEQTAIISFEKGKKMKKINCTAFMQSWHLRTFNRVRLLWHDECRFHIKKNNNWVETMMRRAKQVREMERSTKVKENTRIKTE